MNKEMLTAEGGPVSVANALLATIQEECGALQRLCQSFDAQLEAMRGQTPDTLEAATLSVTEEVGAIARIQQTRERHTRLLARILNLTGLPDMAQLAGGLAQIEGGSVLGRRLLEMRDQAKEQALEAQEHCRQLEFALNYAAHLGRDMLLAVQNTGPAAPTQTYTANGRTASNSGPRSLLNRQG